ncbi:hypothetical protein BS50DRAFT_593428 [Corynespora cassiicola Philippines]|uniref:Uncharacterized protein n=1 Tax=Corynespora cassiicola Philippines TaxID=1448308 RepID=A0A2T2N6M2_CORCC|nr:hypothetical protein BS50DRAFT_593428 [Corynespora cassiicola Philippines]
MHSVLQLYPLWISLDISREPLIKTRSGLASASPSKEDENSKTLKNKEDRPAALFSLGGDDIMLYSECFLLLYSGSEGAFEWDGLEFIGIPYRGRWEEENAILVCVTPDQAVGFHECSWGGVLPKVARMGQFTDDKGLEMLWRNIQEAFNVVSGKSDRIKLSHVLHLKSRK